MKIVRATKNVVNKVRAFFTFKRVFYIGLFFKGFDGMIELLTAIALFFVQPEQIHQLVILVTRNELLEDPHDLIANFLLKSTSSISHDVTAFLMIYLLVHAAVKLVAVFGIILKQLWAYPFALITLGLLTLYQIYDLMVKPSVGIALLTIIDVIVLWLIAREYYKIRHDEDPGMLTRQRPTSR